MPQFYVYFFNVWYAEANETWLDTVVKKKKEVQVFDIDNLKTSGLASMEEQHKEKPQFGKKTS